MQKIFTLWLLALLFPFVLLAQEIALTPPANITVFNTAGKCAADDVHLGTPTVIGPCDPKTSNDAPASFPIGDTKVTWTATNSCGQSATAIQLVTVQDTSKPILFPPPTTTFTDNGSINFTLPPLIVKSDCGIQNIKYDVSPYYRAGTGTDASGTFGSSYNTVTWYVTDVNGNTSSAVTTVRVNASSIPVAKKYVFIGNGVWQDPQNWEGQRVPGTELNRGDSITIKGTAYIQKDSSASIFCCDYFLRSTGVITIAQGGTLYFRNFTQFGNMGTINVYGTLINECAFEAFGGDIHVWGTFINQVNYLAYNRATVMNVGLFVIEDGGTLINESGLFTNNFTSPGVMVLNPNGTIINNDPGVMDLGQLNNKGGTITNHSILKGNVTITGNITNAGTLAPGNSPGTYSITGDYTATSTSIHNFEVGGISIGSYDALNVTGNVNLDGTLNIIPYNGFKPTNAADIPIVSGSIHGTFSSVNIPSDYQLIYNANNVILRAMTGTLPVTFVNLDAVSESKSTKLTWSVAAEINVAKYEVEKSLDGNSFNKIGETAASRLSNYSFNDESPSAKCFYRVKSIDVNGSFKYSTILAFNARQIITSLQAFPTPAANGLTVVHPDARASSKLILSSIDGKTLMVVNLQPGSKQTGLEVSVLKAGVYILKYESGDGEIQTLKITKL